MAALSSGAISFAWKDGAAIAATTVAVWKDGARLSSVGSAYAYPSAPEGSTPVVAGSLAPVRDIAPSAAYVQHVALAVTDLRDGAALPVVSASLDLPDGSDLWTLNATGPAALADALRAGEQPATLQVTIGADSWRFVVEDIDQPLTFGASGVTVRGRSLAAVAGAPFQVQQVWFIDAPTSPAQVCALANAFTGVEVEWGLSDWSLPEGSWSGSADPLGVVRTMAASVNAVVECDRAQYKVRVTRRYPIAPNLWATSTPDVQIAWEAFEQARSERADQPDYDSVLVAGQQSGGTLLARLEGTAGGTQAPMITDSLLTDPQALLERALATLQAFGGRTRETRVLQHHGGVIPRGALVRCVEPAATWTGMVRAVSVQAALERVRQTVVIERPTSFVVGSVAPEPITCEIDPHWANVKCLLHFDDPGNPHVFPDAKGNVWTRADAERPDDMKVTSAESRFGGAALLMRTTTGSSSSFVISAPAAGGPYSLGAGNKFSLEGWVYIRSGPNFVSRVSVGEVLGPSDSAFCGIRASGAGIGELNFYTGLATEHNEVRAIPQNAWVHVMLTFDGTTKRTYINGVLQAATVLGAGPFITVHGYKIGGIIIGSEFVQPAYVDEVRFTAGVARPSTGAAPALPFCEHS